MRRKTSNDSTNRQSIPVSTFITASRKPFLAIGTLAAMTVIGTATAYAMYGQGDERSLVTNDSSNSQPAVLQNDDRTNQTDEGGTVEHDSNQGNQSNQSESTTTIHVNGKQIDVPANGTTSQTVRDGSGTVHITTENHHHTSQSGNSTSNTSSSSVNMNITTQNNH